MEHAAVTELSRDHTRLAARVDLQGSSTEVWFEGPLRVDACADPYVALSLIPAMTAGGLLRVPGRLDATLLANLPTLQSTFRAWSRDEPLFGCELFDVGVVPDAVVARPPASDGRVAAFFSGGVDSFALALDHEDEIDDLLFVHGFDVPIADRELARRIEERLAEAARLLGKPLVLARTNLRSLTDPLILWDGAYGGALASVAHLLDGYGRVLIAGEARGGTQIPRGSDPTVDPLWSTSARSIVHEARRSRAEKLELIADHRVARSALRVCWREPGAYNCGRCEKCLRTMVGLEALGVRRAFTTFPQALDLEAVAALAPAAPNLRLFWKDVRDLAERHGADPRVRQAIDRCLSARPAATRPRVGVPRTSPRPRRRRPPEPTIAVVVPAYRQAQYLPEAVGSALRQDIAPRIRVVIVNDGCPFEATDRISRAFRDARPGLVDYVRRENGGVAAARNTGVRRALERWPTVRAIFPLDADNVLAPQALRGLWTTLFREGADWASPTPERFGADSRSVDPPGPFSLYRQLFENQCDTGTLLSRRIFDAGIFYDETMRNGYEDWEFILRAARAGFRGVPAGRCGFRYRVHPESKVHAAIARHQVVYGEIVDRHRELYEPAALTALEHADLPRFLLVDPVERVAELRTWLDGPASRVASLDAMLSEAHARRPYPWYCPPVLLLARPDVVALLGEEGLLPGIALRCQEALGSVVSIGIAITTTGEDGGVDIEEADALEELTALAVRTTGLAAPAAAEAACRPARCLRVRLDDVPAPLPPWREVVFELAAAGEAVTNGGERRVPAHAAFSAHRHLELLETTVPWSGRERCSE